MSIANLRTLAILGKAKLKKDATGAPGGDATGGAVTTTDLKSGGLLVPEQGGRSARMQMLGRKLRKPVILGKSCSELTVEKAKDALGHGSEKRGGGWAGASSASGLWAGSYGKSPQIHADEAEPGMEVRFKDQHPNHAGRYTIERIDEDKEGGRRLIHVHDALRGVTDSPMNMPTHAGFGGMAPTFAAMHKDDVAKAKDALGHGSEKRNGNAEYLKELVRVAADATLEPARGFGEGNPRDDKGNFAARPKAQQQPSYRVSHDQMFPSTHSAGQMLDNMTTRGDDMYRYGDKGTGMKVWSASKAAQNLHSAGKLSDDEAKAVAHGLLDVANGDKQIGPTPNDPKMHESHIRNAFLPEKA